MDKEYVDSKEKREKEAAILLKQKIPEFSELHELIENYEKRSDQESKFVYVVDKLLPTLSIYLDEGCAWKTHSITPEMIIKKNKTKLKNFPELIKYFDVLIKLIKEKPEYFIN